MADDQDIAFHKNPEALFPKAIEKFCIKRKEAAGDKM